MGKVHEAIDERMAGFLAAQHVFFVATAPAGSDGHVNVSPKGLDTSRRPVSRSSPRSTSRSRW